MMISKEMVLVFDFDGTMVETEKQVLGIMNQLRSRFGLKPMPLQTFRRTGSGLEMLHYKFARLLSRFVVGFVQREQAKNLTQMMIEPGLLSVMRTLHAEGIRMGIVSSNSLSNVTHYLKFHHLTSLFDFVDVSEDLFDKAEVLNQMIVSHGLDRSQVIYIGDETRDVEAAHAASVRVVAVSWGYQNRAGFDAVNPDWIIDSPQELLSLVVKMPWWKRLFLKFFSGSGL